MSTKIYDAYKFTHDYSMYELSHIFDGLRTEIKDICNRDILQKVIAETLYFYNFKQAHGDSDVAKAVADTDPQTQTNSNTDNHYNRYTHGIWKAVQEDKWTTVYVNVYWHIIDEISRGAKSPFRCDYDYRCILQIIPMETKTLAMFFGSPMLRDYLESHHDFLTDYHYQNQTDRPENIPEEEWNLREKDWDKAIGPDYIPIQHGFSAELFNTDSIMPIFVPSEVEPVPLPNIEHQMRGIRDTLSSISDVEGYPQSKRYSAWSAFKKNEPYKQWVADCNKMIQEKCRLITDFHEFCELVVPRKGELAPRMGDES